jgi:hypothetical protein
MPSTAKLVTVILVAARLCSSTYGTLPLILRPLIVTTAMDYSIATMIYRNTCEIRILRLSTARFAIDPSEVMRLCSSTYGTLPLINHSTVTTAIGPSPAKSFWNSICAFTNNKIKKPLWMYSSSLSGPLSTTLLYHQLRLMPVCENTRVGDVTTLRLTMPGIDTKKR